ncbi:C40 family peptidase [Clostridium intestinale]
MKFIKKFLMLFLIFIVSSTSIAIVKANAATISGQDIVNEAKKHLGKPYVYGATGPSSFDCSGFTKYVYGQLGINLSRTTYTQIKEGTSVARADLQAGDLVFTNSGHVGIYVSDGQIIHAPRTGSVVKISPIWTFIGARRILN